MTLGAERVPEGADASLVYWHEIAAAVLSGICHIPETQPFTLDAIDPPDPARITEWFLRRPPMAGAEHVSESCLLEIWHRIVAWTVEQAEGLGGVGSFLAKHAPHWARVGRVTRRIALCGQACV